MINKKDLIFQETREVRTEHPYTIDLLNNKKKFHDLNNSEDEVA